MSSSRPLDGVYDCLLVFTCFLFVSVASSFLRVTPPLCTLAHEEDDHCVVPMLRGAIIDRKTMITFIEANRPIDSVVFGLRKGLR